MKNFLILVSFVLSISPPLGAAAQTSCTGQLAENIITNGDFGEGAASIQGFDPFYAPNYVYQQSTALSSGQYTIAHSSQLPANNCWINTNDNSNNSSGYLMLVNTAANAAIFYQRSFEVCDGISYLLSIDLINLLQNACEPTAVLPNIDILIDGQTVLQSGPLPEDENWHTFSQLIDIPAGTDFITLALRNNTTGGVGNDFGIDNISLRHCGPQLMLAATSFVCQTGGSISIDETLISYPTPYYQWQQSFDAGIIWQNINGAQNSSLLISNPNIGIYYRVLVANGPINFLSESCRIVSNASRLDIFTPIEVFNTPVICEGDSIQVGDDIFKQAGDYTTLITGNSGCDSLIHTLLFTNPTYDHWFSQSLCAGDSFLGQVFNADTILEQSLISNQGCDSMLHYEINVLSINELLITGTTQLCEGQSSTLSLAAAYPNYSWSTGEDAASIEVSQAGNYSLTVSNAQGCEYSTNVEVQVSRPFMETMTRDPSCPGANDASIEVLFYEGGIAPYSFSLDAENWMTENSFPGLSPGTYVINLKDAIGCESTQLLWINEADAMDAVLAGLPETGVEAGDSIYLQVVSSKPDLTYNWSGDGLFSCTDCEAVQWMPFSDGFLHLLVEDAKGCSLIIDTSIVILEPLRVFIPNAFSPNNDGHNDTFFPATGSNVSAIHYWSIYDRWGGEMFTEVNRSPNDSALAWDGKWRGELQANGAYVYRAKIEFNNGRTKVFTGEVMLIK